MANYIDKIIEVLTRCKEQGEIVGISTDSEDTGKFAAGFVVQVGRSGYVLELIDTDGEPDGIRSGSVDDIVEFHVDTDYLRAVRALYSNRGAIFHPVLSTPNYKDGRPTMDILRWAKESHEIVSLFDGNRSTLSGYVADVGDDYIELEIITREGTKDGVYYVRSEDVFMVSCGSKRDQQTAFLHRKRYEIGR